MINRFSKYVQPFKSLFSKLTFKTITILFLAITSCAKTGNEKIKDLTFREDLENKIFVQKISTDSLIDLYNYYTDSKNNTGIYLTSHALGIRNREMSDFTQAIHYHHESLNAALLLEDTIFIAQAYNNIGTNLRRIGVLPEAADYHYQALKITERFHDADSLINQKNRLMALNGIGNIALSLNDFDEAENKFREALQGEIKMQSNLGQAINYANIGAIFQKRRQYDSAFHYYDLSMIKNQLIGSKLGMGLCYKHFGQIFEDQEDYVKAEREFQKSYEMMEGMNDKWHWLEACLSLSRINIKLNHFNEALKYLSTAKETAEMIKSPEHLSEVYALYEAYYSKLGKFKDALENNKLSVMFQDSIVSIQKNNQITDIRVNYEREKNLKYIEQLNLEKEIEMREKRVILAASTLALLLLISLSVSLWYAFLQRTKKNKMLRETDKVKSNFFTNITHEFRTPLTIILGHSRQLQKRTDISSDEKKLYLSAIEKQGVQMLRLVNQLLDIAKVNAGMDMPEWKNGNIVAFMEKMIERYRLFVTDKDISFSFYPKSPVIEMDFVPNYISDIFQNLLSNAVEYSTNHGMISVYIDSDGKNVILKVADNGMGISEEDMERIFDLFYQVPKTNKQGSGIGLAFVKQLVEHMKGTINVKSQINQGTEFTITLPIKTTEKVVVEKWDADTEPSNNPNLPQSCESVVDSKVFQENSEVELAIDDTKPTLLVIEDNNDVLLYMQSLLKTDYNVVTAVDGVDGMEKALKVMPDIIITDAMMPRKDGCELCKEVKSSNILNHIPIIMITAKATSEDMLEGLKCGADLYIRKPFQPEELLVRISNLLELIKTMKIKYMKAVLEEDTNEVTDSNLIFLQEVANFIHQNLSDPSLAPRQVAEYLNISPSQLNRKMNSISGFSSSAYILQVKIDHAKKLLAKRDKNVGEVAEACGFLDTAYFSRTFKKITGVTPSSYRNLPQ